MSGITMEVRQKEKYLSRFILGEERRFIDGVDSSTTSGFGQLFFENLKNNKARHIRYIKDLHPLETLPEDEELRERLIAVYNAFSFCLIADRQGGIWVWGDSQKLYKIAQLEPHSNVKDNIYALLEHPWQFEQ
jgi:hypothetical protein